MGYSVNEIVQRYNNGAYVKCTEVREDGEYIFKYFNNLNKPGATYIRLDCQSKLVAWAYGPREYRLTKTHISQAITTMQFVIQKDGVNSDYSKLSDVTNMPLEADSMFINLAKKLGFTDLSKLLAGYIAWVYVPIIFYLVYDNFGG